MTLAQAGPSGVCDDARARRRTRLIACAEAAVAERGLDGLRARELAVAVGCSVGAIYNLVADLDELALLVGQRTMADLDAFIDAACPDSLRDGTDEDVIVGWALAYAAFAAANRQRWRALFEFRMPPGRDLPDWFALDQVRMFGRLERRLAAMRDDWSADERGRRARILFSAVHGIVVLGLEGKLVSLPVEALEHELAAFVRTYLVGLRDRPAAGAAFAGEAAIRP